MVKINDLESMLNEASRCLSCKVARCKLNGCPLHNDIPSFIKALKENDINKAYDILMETSNMPSICSRVCDYESQCVKACILNAKGNPISIPELERFVFDHKSKTISKVPLKDDVKVAVIGSGPSALSLALELVKNGVKVDVYEKNSYIGGLLLDGIPSYRLPINVLNEYIDFTKYMGVNYILNSYKKVKDLQNDYDYVVLASGLSSSRKLDVKNYDERYVIDAIKYLKKENLKDKLNILEGYKLHGKVIVVGGGNAALDAAKVAKLNHLDVTIVYRRSQEEMPSSPKELQEAMDLGVKFLYLTNPSELILKDDKLVKIRLEKMNLGELDSSNRRKPIPSGDFFEIDANYVISAIGQVPGNEAKENNLLEDHKYIKVNDNYETNIPNVFAIGDITLGASSVVKCVKAGKELGQYLLKLINDRR